MQKISFIDIPQHYKDMINNIREEMIQNIFQEKFIIRYFPFETIKKAYNDENSEIEQFKNENMHNTCIYQEHGIKYEDQILFDFLFTHLKNYKFMTYDINQQVIMSDKNEKKANLNQEIFNFIVCYEDECLIIEEIPKNYIKKLIELLKMQNISMINDSSNLNILNTMESKEEEEIKTENESKNEIDKFCSNFNKEIKNNIIVKYLIRSMIGYLIRRYFYPSSFFKNQSFFTFEKQNRPKDEIIKDKIKQLFNEKSPINEKVMNSKIKSFLYDLISFKNYKKQNKIINFKEENFIILRDIFSSGKATFHLVIHKKTFYIFMMKKIFSGNFQREIDFCKKFSHRCITRFYGFLKENFKIVGFIYEFQSNGPLSSYKQNNDLFSIIAISRIFEAIEYIHSNSFIHRDLKPSNILINHDHLPFVSDFDTIRVLNDEPMTNDIGSQYYSSPEQDLGENISFATDIYSFGLIIYFIKERRNMFSSISSKEKGIIKSITKCSSNIQQIYQSCVKENQKERMTKEKISNILNDEFNSFFYLEEYLLKSVNNVNTDLTPIIEFIFDQIINQQTSKSLSLCSIQITFFFKLYFGLLNNGNFNSYNILYNLGSFYLDGIGVKQDYNKAFKYFEQSSELNNSSALNNLGYFYEHGIVVKQDYNKALEYYKQSSELNNSYALNNLGYLYLNGRGVKQDYNKALKYYKQSSELNNSYALNNLGSLYLNGRGVKQDYKKALEYFEQSSKLNNSDAFYILGSLYLNGRGVKQDYNKAFKYFEQSSKLNNSYALYNLGYFYEHGIVVRQDYNNALKYYEQSSKLNNSYALNNLGYLYEHELGVKKDYNKALKYYEQSSKLNNSDALYNLGYLYEHELGVKQNYNKALKYYEQSSKLNNSSALYNLGYFYEHGLVVKQNYNKALKYYEQSSKLNNSNAHFALGCFYSVGDKIDVKIQKAIYYFNKSIQNQIRNFITYDVMLNCYVYQFEDNFLRYISFNDLGLIYLIVLNDIGNAKEYIKESAFAEYPFGQNNFGLICQFYLNENKNARHMFERSSKHHFSLAEYNLGHIFEKDKKIDESIKFYVRASEHENEPLKFRLIENYNDKRLEISKTFIICFTNLKLAEFYFNDEKFFESKKYFAKSIKNLRSLNEELNYSFKIKILISKEKEYSKDMFSYLKKFILNFPPFNLINQPEIPKIALKYLNQNESNSSQKKKEEKDPKIKINNNEKRKINNKNIREKQMYYKKCKNDKKEIIFKKPDDLFDFVIKESESNSKSDSKPKLKLKDIFISEIKEIIHIMNEILYTPPFSILFGRISIEKHKPIIEENDRRQNINQDFYDGFGLN